MRIDPVDLAARRASLGHEAGRRGRQPGQRGAFRQVSALRL